MRRHLDNLDVLDDSPTRRCDPQVADQCDPRRKVPPSRREWTDEENQREISRLLTRATAQEQIIMGALGRINLEDTTPERRAVAFALARP